MDGSVQNPDGKQHPHLKITQIYVVFYTLQRTTTDSIRAIPVW